jgi:hypothetical protein
MAGYTASSGAEPFKPELALMHGLRGDRLGGYAAAGIKIIYRIGQRTYAWRPRVGIGPSLSDAELVG